MANKFGAKRCDEDGYTFASLAEREEYRRLKLRVLAGEIEDLEVHPAYPFVVNEQKVGRFTLDFGYYDKALGRRVIVDVKSRPTRTEAYMLRKRLLFALYGLTVTEVVG